MQARYNCGSSFARMRVDGYFFTPASLCAVSPRAFLEPDRPAKCCQDARIPGCAIRSVPRKTHMDTTTLLIIVLVILLLGGGWYGRGRWY